MRQGNLEFSDRFPGRFQPHAEHFCPRSVVVSLSQVRADCALSAVSLIRCVQGLVVSRIVSIEFNYK